MRYLIALSAIFASLSFADNLSADCSKKSCLQKWACDTVYSYATRNKIYPKLGCYDICSKLEKNSKGIHGLKDSYPMNLQNACAITLYGAEY